MSPQAQKAVESQNDYELLLSGICEDTIPVQLYKSKSTGIRVVLCQVPGPLVNGYFLLATEAHDDDGLPHTLEHLVFMGSEDFPYKGVLDMLANRCFAQGTNAWTDTDHTVYTVETAGSEGFLSFLPVSKLSNQFLLHVGIFNFLDLRRAHFVSNFDRECLQDGSVSYHRNWRRCWCGLLRNAGVRKFG